MVTAEGTVAAGGEPSGLAVATASMPSAPPPPALLTRTSGTPRLAESCGWMRRMAVSVGPPGAKGMMHSMGRVGYGACARAGAPAMRSAIAVASVTMSRSGRMRVTFGQGKRPRAHLLGPALEGIPLLEARPHSFAGLLCLATESIDVHAGDVAIAHAHHAVDNHGFHIVADAALDEALDGIAHRTVPEGAAAHEVHDHDVRLGPRRQTTKVVAAESPRAAQGGRGEDLGGGGGKEVVAHDLAEVGGGAHL